MHKRTSGNCLDFDFCGKEGCRIKVVFFNRFNTENETSDKKELLHEFAGQRIHSDDTKEVVEKYERR